MLIFVLQIITMVNKNSIANAELERIVKLLLVTNKFSEDHQKKIYIIINNVAKVCNTSEQAIIHDKGRGELTDARHLCFYFLRRKISISLKSIAEIFLNRTPSTHISTGIKRITILDPKNRQDGLLLKKRDEIDTNLKLN